MIKEIKKIWEKDKIGITIILLLELLISIFGKFYNERMITGHLKVMVSSDFLLFLQFTLLAGLVFFFASQKQNLIQYEESLPQRRIFLFFSRFIPGLLITIIFSYLILAIHNEAMTFDTFGIILYIAVLFFVIVYLWFYYRNLFWILLGVAFILGILFPFKVTDPLNTGYVLESRSGFETPMLVAFLVPLVFYFFNYSHNISHTNKVIVITILVYTVLNFTSLGYQTYSHSRQPTDVLGYENYISVIKSRAGDIRSIYYDLEAKKTLRKPQHRVKTYLWDPDRIIYSIDKRIIIKDIKASSHITEKTYILNKKIKNLDYHYFTKRMITDLDRFFHQENGKVNNIYYYTSKSLSRLDIDTFKKEIVMKDVSLNSPSLSILSVKDTNCIYIAAPSGIKESTIGKANLLWDNIGIYYTKGNKILGENGNIIYEFKNDNKSFVSPRKFADGNNWKTIYNGNTYDIPKDCKFNGDKIYYREDDKIIFCYIDGREIVRMKIKANKKKNRDNFFIYQYKSDYYLFLYRKNPIRVYKLVSGKWEFYDRFS